jgi:phosphoglycolate phosphatase
LKKICLSRLRVDRILPALLFDLDGTLVDSAPDIAIALSILSERRGGPAIAPTIVRPLVSLGAATLVSRALGTFARGDADLEEFRKVLGKLSPNPDDIFPYVRDVLCDLHSAGRRMAVVTNKPEGLSRSLLEKLSLSQFFSAIIGGDTTAFAKPHPLPLQTALKALNATERDAIFIGDSDVDAEAALRCSIPFILFRGGYGMSGVNVSLNFKSYNELLSLLDKYHGQPNGKIAMAGSCPS